MTTRKPGKVGKAAKTLPRPGLVAAHEKSIRGGVRKAGEKPIEYFGVRDKI